MKRYTIKPVILAAFTAVVVLSMTACSDTSDKAAPPDAIQTPAPAPSPSPTPSPSPSPAPSHGNNGTTDPSSKPQKDEAQAYVKQIMEQAKKGKVPGNDYAAHTSLIDEVEKNWGKPDTTDTAGKGIYATYKQHKAAFGFNKGSLIFDVRSYDSKLNSISLTEIKSALGNPADAITNKTETIYVYKASEQFELKFIIPESSGKVDHISVYSPQDTKNNMAG